MPAGTAKLKFGGGHGGHNGLKDIHAALGTADYWRLRLGIDHPGDRNEVINYVLKAPTKVEKDALEANIHAACGVVDLLLKGEFESAMLKLQQITKQRMNREKICNVELSVYRMWKIYLFNAITKAGIAAENYPFCTIEPNVGIVEVPDPRMQPLIDIVKPQKVQPAIVEFVDIAGLVAGASKGEGLGNKFLANIRETDAIAHVVRCFEDGNVIHVANKIDPLSDIEVINTELALGRHGNG